jgi:secreted trypsin-like serine protease
MKPQTIKNTKGGVMREKSVVSLAVLATVFASVGAFAGMHEDIIGGVNVQQGNPIASSTVMIIGETTVNGKAAEYICSGSLLASDMLVTAAHCVADNPQQPTDPTKMIVVFGTSMPTSVSDPTVHQIYGYKANPGWTAAIQQPDAHDIAIIRFKGGLPAGYAPATLLDASVALNPGEDVTLAGYGIDSIKDKTGKSAGTLREVDTTIAQAVGTTEIGLDESHGRGSCSGDSGGPAFLNVNGSLQLWGVTSRGDQKCAQMIIYTKISSYLDFISQAEQELEQLQ